MHFLSRETVEKTWDELHYQDMEQLNALIEDFSQKQPYILAYLMATGSDVLTEEDRETLVFMGLTIWKIVENNFPDVPKIEGDILDQKEEQNMKMLEYLAGEPESEFMDTVDIIMKKYPQSDVLRFVIDEIMDEQESMISPDKDNIGIVVIYLKTVLDCFDEIIN